MAASRTRHAIDDPHMFSSSDDNAMLNYIIATHAPDGTYFDVTPFLEIIENIVHTANQANQAELGSIVEQRSISNDVNEILEVMALTINMVSCEPITVGCASILINLIGKGQEHIIKTTYGWELSSLAHKISNFYDHLRNQLVLCYQHVEEKRQTEAYQTILRIMDTPHLDNVTPLRHLISSSYDALYVRTVPSRGTKVMIDVLRTNIVLLSISDLDLSIEEISVLGYMYREARPRIDIQYEVVWLPIVPNDRETPFAEQQQRQFEELRSMIPWYSVDHSSLLKPTVIKYIKEVWHFKHKPLLVVMDPQGRIVHTNVLHMIWIWGNEAFPFTRRKKPSRGNLENGAAC